MGKLIELLNEYLFGLGRKTIIENYRKDCLEDVCGTFRGIVEGKKDYPYTSIWGIEVISKKFGFIKWLVENEKIDLDKAKILESGNKAELFEFIERADYMKIRNRSYFSEYKQLLMLLSIQDEPIEFLVSILK